MKLKIAAAVAVLVLAVAGFFVFTQKPAAPDVTFSRCRDRSSAPPTCAARWCW